MKRKILVPMFTSVMALSMNIVANADNVEKKDTESKEDSKTLKKSDVMGVLNNVNTNNRKISS